MLNYFFSGSQYIAVERGDVGYGAILPGYPKPISDWGWGSFGATGIDAALYSGSKCYFFKGTEYIRVTRGQTDFGHVDPGYPHSIKDWNFPSGFGATGIDAAMWSGPVCYFFKGNQYVRMHRDDTSIGTVDQGYPKDIGSGWTGLSFASGTPSVDAALYSGTKAYFFSKSQYAQISEADLESPLVDTFPAQNIADWKWGSFGSNGIDAALNSGGPLAAPPAGGARSNLNYFVHADGDILTGVTVTINFDELSHVIPHAINSDLAGWGVQLNCYSLNSPSITTLWQQFILEADTGESRVAAHINNWISGPNQLINTGDVVATMPGIDLAPGTCLSFNLNTDNASNVIGCTYTVTYEGDPSAESFFPGLKAPTTKSLTLNLLTRNDLQGKAIASSELAPIVAMQVNIVGHFDGQNTVFTSGAGTINYKAAQQLTVSNSEPSFTTFGTGTGETSNMTYGPMPAGHTSNPTQIFRADTSPSHLPPGVGRPIGIPLSKQISSNLVTSGNKTS